MFVFGEPYEASHGVVIVTVSRHFWGGRVQRPVGIYTVRENGTMWTPAVDVNWHSTIGLSAGFVAALLSTIAVLRRPPWPEMTERVMIALAQARSDEGGRQRR
ncbi:hypothetical protein ACFVX3_32610 [Rhodococcus erythropolis]